jgi:hypothetical protein
LAGVESVQGPFASNDVVSHRYDHFASFDDVESISEVTLFEHEGSWREGFEFEAAEKRIATLGG